MHLLLTDILSCPRCGPSFGVILLADRINERRVRSGQLGCPNCRDAFEIRDGFVDLRAPPRREAGPGRAGEPPAAGAPWSERDVEEFARLAALLGVVRGPGTVALVGEPARALGWLARTIEDLGVVGIDPDLREWSDDGTVSRMMASPGLPFFDRVLRGVALDGRLQGTWVTDAARVVAPKSRVVVVHAPPETAETLRASGLEVLVDEAETVVATRG